MVSAILEELLWSFCLFSLKNHCYKRFLISSIETAPYVYMLDSGQQISKLEIVKL